MDRSARLLVLAVEEDVTGDAIYEVHGHGLAGWTLRGDGDQVWVDVLVQHRAIAEHYTLRVNML